MELLSEEEQTEALKAWLRRNGPFIIGAIVLALAVNFGFRWWQGHGQREAELAGGSYQRVLDQFDAGKIDEALALIEALRGDHPKSPYVAAADLAATRVFVARNELDKAELRLKRVAGYMEDPQLKPLAVGDAERYLDEDHRGDRTEGPGAAQHYREPGLAGGHLP